MSSCGLLQTENDDNTETISGGMKLSQTHKVSDMRLKSDVPVISEDTTNRNTAIQAALWQKPDELFHKEK